MGPSMNTPTPEKIDQLAAALATMGVHVPPRDTAFFQAIVQQWVASLPDSASPSQEQP